MSRKLRGVSKKFALGAQTGWCVVVLSFLGFKVGVFVVGLY